MLVGGQRPELSSGKAHETALTERGEEVCGTHGVGVKSVDIMGNTKGESSTLAFY